MVWSSKKAKWVAILIAISVILIPFLIYLNQIIEESKYHEMWGFLIPAPLILFMIFCPTQEQAKISKSELINEYGLKEFRHEEGMICEDVIVNGGKEFKLLETDGGYTGKVVKKMLDKNRDDVINRSILVRLEPPNLNRGTAFSNFGLYVETGRILK